LRPVFLTPSASELQAAFCSFFSFHADLKESSVNQWAESCVDSFILKIHFHYAIGKDTLKTSNPITKNGQMKDD